MAKNKSNSKKRGSIQTRLLGVMIPIMALAVIIIMSVSYFNTKAKMVESATQALELEAGKNVKTIEAWVNAIVSPLTSVKGTLETVKFQTESDELEYLTSTTTLNENIPNGVYEGDASGFYLDGSGWEPDSDYVITERDWYKEGMTHDSIAFGKPYIDADTGEFVVSATSLLKGSDKRVMSSDVFLSNMTSEVAAIDIMGYSTGYAFLVDTSADVILAHKDKEMNAKSLSDATSNPYIASIADSIQSKSYGVMTKDNNGSPYYTSIEGIDGTSWVLVSCVSENEVLDELHRLQLMYLIIALVVFVVAAIFMGIVINRIITPVKALTAGISHIADGDFTVEIMPKGNDEITVMSVALRDYIERMNGVIKEIIDISKQLEDKSGICSSTSEVLFETADNQAASMKEMRETIDQLAKAVTDIAQNASSLAQVAFVTSNKGSEANDKMKSTVEIADKGYKDMQNVQVTMQEIVSSINDLSEVVGNVGQSTKEINEILALIEDIASQTNLLSLNAAIEAARAGDVGKGFAVVAGEIGHLADVSSNSTHQISEIVAKINNQVEEMVDKTKLSVTNIENNSAMINSACTTFQAIFEDIEVADNLVGSMLVQIQQVDDVANNMAAISEEQSASAEEILATVELLAVNSDEVVNESKQVEECAVVVAESSQTLEDNMKRFKIK